MTRSQTRGTWHVHWNGSPRVITTAVSVAMRKSPQVASNARHADVRDSRRQLADAVGACTPVPGVAATAADHIDLNWVVQPQGDPGREQERGSSMSGQVDEDTLSPAPLRLCQLGRNARW